MLQFDEKKFDIQTREQPMLARLRELNWQISVKKAPICEEDFAFHIFNMAQNNLARLLIGASFYCSLLILNYSVDESPMRRNSKQPKIKFYSAAEFISISCRPIRYRKILRMRARFLKSSNSFLSEFSIQYAIVSESKKFLR